MIITCGNCQAKFKVAPEQIKETGSKVRCSNCRHVFTVFRPQKAARPSSGSGLTALLQNDESLDLTYEQIQPSLSRTDALDEFLDELDSDSEPDYQSYHLDEFFEKNNAGKSPGHHPEVSRQSKPADETELDFSFLTEDDDYIPVKDLEGALKTRPRTSSKERRENRRHLYADQLDDFGADDFDDEVDVDYLTDIPDYDLTTNRPPLRRAPRLAKPPQADNADLDVDDLGLYGDPMETDLQADLHDFSESENHIDISATTGDNYKNVPHPTPQTAASAVNQQQTGLGESQPQFAQQQPGLAENQQQFAQQQPSLGENQPQFAQQQAGFGGNQPQFDQQQAGLGENQPQFDQQQAGLGENQPQFAPQQAGLGGNQPQFAQQQAGLGESQPQFAQPQVGLGGNQPQFNQQQAGLSGNQPQVAQPQAGFDGNQLQLNQQQAGLGGNQPQFNQQQAGLGGNQPQFNQQQAGLGENQQPFVQSQPGLAESQPQFNQQQASFGGNQPQFTQNQTMNNNRTRPAVTARDDLGLSADPTVMGPEEPWSAAASFENDEGGEQIGSDLGNLNFNEELASTSRDRRNARRSSKKPLLGLILAMVAALLSIGIYFLSSRPQRYDDALVVSDGQEITATENGPNTTGQTAQSSDADGTAKIIFTESNQNHYIRNNKDSGKILVITGTVRNSYSNQRSFIRLRGMLLGADGSILSERRFYAGNLLSEDDLINLPMAEIISRLSIQGGQNNSNMNIDPGKEIPFMIVFNNLPDGMTEYKIDPVSSSPGQ